ncbi:MAG: hypothetical protein QNK20_16025 [Aureibaculum sp.]|nr:hypothetical protein [Aureibaculum sp.]
MTNEFLIFNKSRESILGIRKGQGVQLSHILDTIDITKENAVKAYFIGSNTNLTSTDNIIRNVFAFHDKNILVIDSLGIYNLKNYSEKYILLRQSPNINLARLIKKLNPELIIADASNYKSHIALWQKTCENHNIKFHYTVTDGAFIEKL